MSHSQVTRTSEAHTSRVFTVTCTSTLEIQSPLKNSVKYFEHLAQKFVYYRMYCQNCVIFLTCCINKALSTMATIVANSATVAEFGKTACVDATRLPPPLLSPLHPPHLTRVLAGTRLAFDLACVMSVGDSRCPGVRLRVKAHFHFGCALRFVQEIQRRGQCFYFSHHAMPCNTTRSRHNGNKGLSKHSARQRVERR